MPLLPSRQSNPIKHPIKYNPQAELEDKVPSGQLALEEECRGLAELSLAEVEMPGLYLAGHDVTPDSVVMLESFGANIAIVRRHCTSYRRLVMFGSDGKARHMLVGDMTHPLAASLLSCWSTQAGELGSKLRHM